MPDIIKINNHKIGRGEQQIVRLKLARLPSFESIELEVHLFRAKKKGPTLLLTGGMHGDEINGVEILRRLIAQKKLKPEAGTIITVPLINVFGFIQRERDMPDGKDVNRSFPGSKSGSLARLVANTIMKQVLPYVDFGVDFHTGGQSRCNFPQLRCRLDVEQNLKLAKAFAPPMIVNSTFIDHSFRQAAHRKGKQILVYESGEANRFYEPGIQAGIDGILRLMKHLGMRSDAPANEATDVFNDSTWIRAKSAGLFHSKIELGDTVAKNQIIGTITDPYGQRHYKVKNPVDGRIMGLNKAPVIHKGDALVHVAYDEV